VSAADILEGGTRPFMSVFHRGHPIRKAS